MVEDNTTSEGSFDLGTTPPQGKWTITVPGHFITASSDLVPYTAGVLKRIIWSNQHLTRFISPAFSFGFTESIGVLNGVCEFLKNTRSSDVHVSIFCVAALELPLDSQRGPRTKKRIKTIGLKNINVLIGNQVARML